MPRAGDPAAGLDTEEIGVQAVGGSGSTGLWARRRRPADRSLGTPASGRSRRSPAAANLRAWPDDWPNPGGDMQLE